MFLHDISQVFIVFLKGVPSSNSFYPIFFAQSSPLLTYIGEPKGRKEHPHIKDVMLGILQRFFFFLGNIEKEKKKTKHGRLSI